MQRMTDASNEIAEPSAEFAELDSTIEAESPAAVSNAGVS